MRIITLLSLVFVLLLACIPNWNPYSGKSISKFDKNSFPSKSTLQGKASELQADSIRLPNKQLIIGDFIIFSDLSGEGAVFTIYDFKNKVYHQRGKRGLGPGELEVAWTMSRIDNSSFIASCLSSRKIVAFEIHALIATNEYQWEEKLSQNEYVDNPILKDDEVFYTKMATGSERLYHSKLGIPDVEYGTGSLLTKKHANESDFVHANLCTGFLRRFGDMLAFCYLSAPLIEFYNTKTHNWVSFQGPDDHEIKYSVGVIDGTPLLQVIDGVSRDMYLDSFVTDTHIYFLYSGKLLSKDEARATGNDIFIFDNQLRFKHHFTLDQNISSFSVRNDSLLYGLRFDLLPEIVEYRFTI